jgi:hypothetical protein
VNCTLLQLRGSRPKSERRDIVHAQSLVIVNEGRRRPMDADDCGKKGKMIVKAVYRRGNQAETRITSPLIKSWFGR